MEEIEWTPAPYSMRRMLANLVTGVGLSHIVGGLIIILFSPVSLHLCGIAVEGSRIGIGVGVLLVGLVITLTGRLIRRR